VGLLRAVRLPLAASLGIALLGCATHSGQRRPAQTPALATAAQNSYLFGLTFGGQLRNVGITNEVQVAEIARGLRDGLRGKTPTPADQQQLEAFVRAVGDAAVARNQTAATQFLAANAHAPGVVTTSSGLQYKIIAPGDASAPPIRPSDQVTAHYRGRLLDGSEFDSSYARGEPATFPVTGVIRGWQEALVLMKPGAKWQLFVPPALAYGTTARPGIPGGSLLIFDVEIERVAR
jgi:FKBP-type peptidyl-prolyl cis-trans isomerase